MLAWRKIMKTIKRCFYCSLIIAAISLAGAALNVSAATFTVTNTNNTGAGSLRQAILDAAGAAGSDTIEFDASFLTPRTIVLATVITYNPANSADAVTITGPGANLLTLDGNNVTSILHVEAGDQLSISGVTVTRGINGAIATEGTLIVDNSIFTSNSGVFLGGAIEVTTGSSQASVTNSTFTSNSSGYGGAIGTNGASLTVTNCTFTGNTATSGSATGQGGGAIHQSSSGSTTITGSTFTGNAETGGSGGGGAIRNRSGTMNISNSTFTNNTGLDGGGAIQGGGITHISGSTFTGNSASGPNAQQSGQGSGGAISHQGSAQTTISDSVITGNSAVNHGGGIYYQPNGGGASMTVTNTTISNNVANTNNDVTGSGGGVYVTGTGVATVRGSTISGNLTKINTQTTDLRFSGEGGGFFVEGALTLENSTVSGNIAEQSYGGIVDVNPGGTADQVHISNSTIVNNHANGNCGGFGIDSVSDSGQQSLRNTIIANNTAGVNPDVRTASPINSLGYNLIENITGANIGGNTTGNIYGQDPLLGPLEDNGGPTFTHAPLLGSPAVDKGSSFGATTDQRLFPRPFDYPGIASAAGGDGSDIGAVEMQPTADLSGHVGTPTGLNLRNAIVILTDSQGARRTATTSSFGLFTFTDIPTGTGMVYTLSIASKRYRFAARQMNVNGDRDNLDFVGLE